DPNIAFLAGSGIDTDVGVIVDQSLRTNVPNIFAAGDCAELRPADGRKPLVQKLWYTSQPQGWVAGENMAGGAAAYDPGLDYQSAMFMDLDFCSVGEMPARHADYPREETVTSQNGVDSLRLVHDGETVVGASFLGTALTKEDIEYWVVTRAPLAEALEAAGRVLRPRRYDRGPVSRVAPRRQWSRLPNLWPERARGEDHAA
ncbi:MAG: hypothetical protein FJX74_22240, partial [Armatimonadetes bacterium]|nr:hypothetical protein [Armatimonadota bacterium]